jgi:multicomponent Na+:H+ antiporter subunit A
VTILLALHAVLGLAAIAGGDRLGRRALWLGAIGPVAAVGWLLAVLPRVLDRRPVEEVVRWVPALDVDLQLRLDGFAALMVVLVSGIGVLVFAYAGRYLSPTGPGVARLVGLLTLFSGSMLGLVVADNLIVLYGFWELTSITSFLLIGNGHRDARARAAALQALLVTGAGGLAMLAGFVVLGQAAGTYRLSALLADPPEVGTAVTAALILILLGAFTKSAQYPFHAWLPGAMVAPTPVSAYLHSATMVKAGVYLIARLAPVFADDVGLWRPLVVGVGVVTMLGGGLRALRQTDLKLLLALGTVSQLGFMVAVLGWGTATMTRAGCVLLLGHAAFKAAAFMAVGALDHQHGTRDVRSLPRPTRGWAPVAATAVVSAASMAGVPLALGFIGKEAALDALRHTPGPGAMVALVGITAGSVLTAGYSARFAFGALGRLARPAAAAECAASSLGPPAPGLAAPGALLAVASVVLGVLPVLAQPLVGDAANALRYSDEPVHLALWHGVNVALLLSITALVGGAVLHRARRTVDPVLALGHTPASSAGLYGLALRGLNALADRVTGVAQPGSLPIYLGVIATTAAVIPGGMLLRGDAWPGWPDLVETPAHLPVAALVLGAALAASVVRRRFTAALYLGLVGYAMAGLFVVQGAPDLALTQVAIETLTTVLFVLVLRRLPDRFAHRTPPWRRAIRLAVAGSVGATVFFLALATGAEDPPTPTADAMVARAYPDGEGRNVVNVVLVDFRGFDTLGEITVLTAAAIGTVALARAGRRPHRGDGDPLPGTVDHGTPPAVPLARLVTLDVSVRVVFTAVMVGSLYLLFAGHNQPGGGFAGGIVAGAAVALRYVSGGIDEVRRLSRSQPWTVLGSGVLIAATTALVPLLFGGAVLESAALTLHPPLLGDVKLTSVLAFDVGVYLAVVGLALMVFESFGDDPPPRTVAAGAPGEEA